MGPGFGTSSADPSSSPSGRRKNQKTMHGGRKQFPAKDNIVQQ